MTSTGKALSLFLAVAASYNHRVSMEQVLFRIDSHWNYKNLMLISTRVWYGHWECGHEYTIHQESCRRSLSSLLISTSTSFPPPSRQYLFQCVDLSQPVSAIAYGCQHLVCPIRDLTGCPVAITDLSLCQAPSLLPHQTREVARAFRVLTVALRTLSLVPDHRQQGRGGEEEEGGRKEEDMAVLFNKLLLADLREEISQTDNR